MGITEHLTCLQRNLYAGQKQQLELDVEQWNGSKLGKEYLKAIYCLLFNLYAEYIMRNTGLDKAQAGIKIAGRNTITSDMQMTPSFRKLRSWHPVPSLQGK